MLLLYMFIIYSDVCTFKDLSNDNNQNNNIIDPNTVKMIPKIILFYVLMVIIVVMFFIIYGYKLIRAIFKIYDYVDIIFGFINSLFVCIVFIIYSVYLTLLVFEYRNSKNNNRNSCSYIQNKLMEVQNIINNVISRSINYDQLFLSIFFILNIISAIIFVLKIIFYMYRIKQSIDFYNKALI